MLFDWKVSSCLCEIKVSPEELLNQSERVLNRMNTVKNSFSGIEERVRRTSSYWIGDAGDAQRNAYSGYYESINRMLNHIREHSEDLRTMSGIYTEAENEIKEIIQSDLPSDVII